MRLLVLVAAVLMLVSCTHRKSRQDCQSECKERGAEYVGIVTDGIRKDGPIDTTYDVCQCK